MSGFAMTAGYRPGLIGRITELHAKYYHEHWKFGAYFEAKVATQLADFMLRYDEAADRIWSVAQHGIIEAVVAVDGRDARAKGAHLRWFIASDAVRGHGLGNQLLRAAIDFCRQRAYPSVYLWTFAGLDQARHLYQKAGFAITEELAGETWGRPVIEQKFELAL